MADDIDPESLALIQKLHRELNGLTRSFRRGGPSPAHLGPLDKKLEPVRSRPRNDTRGSGKPSPASGDEHGEEVQGEVIEDESARSGDSDEPSEPAAEVGDANEGGGVGDERRAAKKPRKQGTMLCAAINGRGASYILNGCHATAAQRSTLPIGAQKHLGN